MKGKDQHHTYSTEDILRYLEGKLSPQEMHALESAALEDPFLADAIEGIQSGFSTNELQFFEVDAATIASKLQQRLERKAQVKILSSRIWKAAAIFLLAAGTLVFTYYLWNDNNSSTTLAVKEKNLETTATPDTSVTAVPLTDSNKKEIVVEQHSQAVQPEIAKRSVPAPRLQQLPNAVTEQRQEAEQKQLNNSITTDDNRANSITAPAPATIPEKSKQKEETAIRRKVILGETKKDQPLSKTTDTSDEVIVQGYSTTNKARPTDVMPAVGWEAYDTYLRSQQLDSGFVRGKVRVSFTVSRRGKLSDFKIVSASSPAYSTEAIRIIKEGPEWKSALTKKKTVEMDISF